MSRTQGHDRKVCANTSILRELNVSVFEDLVWIDVIPIHFHLSQRGKTLYNSTERFLYKLLLFGSLLKEERGLYKPKYVLTIFIIYKSPLLLPVQTILLSKISNPKERILLRGDVYTIVNGEWCGENPITSSPSFWLYAQTDNEKEDHYLTEQRLSLQRQKDGYIYTWTLSDWTKERLVQNLKSVKNFKININRT